MRRLASAMIAAVGLLAGIASAWADDGDAAADGPHFKLTPAWYFNDGADDAWDVNLRGDFDSQKVFIGHYADESGARQTRAGYEADPDFGWLALQLSAQVATLGFLGGSAQANVGGDTYAIVGIGRTNLRTYYNLNFDPNDAITLGLGSKTLLPNAEISLYQVRDDRLDTGQRIIHALLKTKIGSVERLTVDANYKRGRDDDGVVVHGFGLGVEFDYRDVFVKLARDPHANFMRADQTRIALGLRF